MKEGVVRTFNSIAEEYDSQREKLIPFMSMYYGTAVDLINLKDEKGKILDLGAGTGLLTRFVLEKYPKANYTLVDIAEDMLKVARKRFENYDNISFKVEDYREGIKDEKYNYIISAMSIHHLDSNEKRELYRNIYNALDDDGIFINADQVLGEDEESEKITKGYQLNHIENCELSREDKDATYERIKLDKMDTMSIQMEMLRDAGFKSVDIYYKFYNYIVFRAKK